MHHTGISDGLSEQEILAFMTFTRVCAEHNLLTRPTSLKEEDIPYGLTDDATLLLVLLQALL